MTDDKHTSETSLRKRPVGRRDLLKIGATSAVLPAMVGPAAVTERKPRQASAAGNSESAITTSGPVSIGYWSGEPDAALINARSMGASDSKIVTAGAQIQMIGMGQGDDGQSGLQSLKIDLGIGKHSFRAWRYENSGVRNVSSPTVFSVPIDAKQGLRFAVTAVHTNSANIVRSGSFTLHASSHGTVASLRAGFYVVALGSNGSTPRIRWDGFEIAGDNTGQSFYLRKNGKPVTSFPYLIFTVSEKPRGNGQYV